MKMEKQDWVDLRGSLLLATIIMICVMTVCIAAHYFSHQRQAALQHQLQRLNAARQRLALSGTEKNTIIEYLPQYQKLIDKGFVGEERRMQWLDHLQTLHKTLQLSGIQYTISPREAYKPGFAAHSAELTLYRAVMKIEFDMLHEGDLLSLTEAMSRMNASPFMLRDCEISRQTSHVHAGQLLGGNLHAICELDWLTLREPAKHRALSP